MRHRLVLTNTFFGFDRAVHVPPNLVCTGPVMQPDITSIDERLEAISADLHLWLTQAVNDGKPVVFISLGSEVKWQPWYVKAFYEGCISISK